MGSLCPISRCEFEFFFFNDTATTEIYTLSLHDALPISPPGSPRREKGDKSTPPPHVGGDTIFDYDLLGDRKSTRLNSSHRQKSYAVFCFEKKKKPCNGFTSHTTHIIHHLLATTLLDQTL